MTKTVGLLAALVVALAGLPVEKGLRAQAAAPLLVIVGNVTGSVTDIPLATLRRAFQGEIAQVNGKRLIPFNQAGGTSERIWFDRSVLGLQPEDVGRFWIDRRIRDEGALPRVVGTRELAIKVVASLPGAITYVSSSSLNKHVHAVTIDGRAPSRPDYPLVVP
jgi:hypothetical protein